MHIRTSLHRGVPKTKKCGVGAVISRPPVVVTPLSFIICFKTFNDLYFHVEEF